MLKQLIQSYFVFGLLLGLYFVFRVADDYQSIYLLNQIFFLLYGGVLLFMYRNPGFFANESSLLWLIAVYVAIVSTSINTISFYYTGNFFSFSEVDARLYDDLGRRLQFDGDAVRYITSSYSFDDWGAIFMTGLVYAVGESNLSIDVFYWLLSILTARYMFRLSANFMAFPWAAMCTFAFVCSSYSIWFATTGLKESFMLFVIVFGYYAYIRFSKGQGNEWLIYSISVLGLLIFFRPILLLFVLLSFSINSAFKLQSGLFRWTIVLLSVGVVIGFVPIQDQLSSYLGKTSVAEFVESQSDSERVRGGIVFTYAVNVLSALAGAFPTIASETKPSQYFWISGLIFKVLLSVALILGVWQILRSRYSDLNVLLFFPLLEASALILILDALELRKSLPHYPMLYIVAFWFLSQESLRKSLWHPIFVKRFASISLTVLFLFIVFWNFRM